MDSVDKLLPTARKVDDHSHIKFKSLFIDMDLAMHKSSNSPRVRRLLKTLDSHEDFEFSMSHSMFMDGDSVDQAMELASADKLFFKGQILPLQCQADAKRQLSQPMACPSLETDYCEKRNSFRSLHTLNQSWRRYLLEGTSENPLEKHGSEIKDCFTICHNEEMSAPPLQVYSSQHLMHANEEGTSGAEFALQEGIDIMRSHRLEYGTFGPDSCSSSFRSHHSNNYWSSAEKDSRDSSSSSRCSNGSHHDSAYIQSIEKKAPQSILSIQLIKASHPAGVQQSEPCEIMGDLSLSANPSHRSNHPKPPISASLSSRKWSWKGLFTSLRKASKLWVDDGRAGDAERKKILASKGEKRPIFTFKELSGVLGENEIGYRRSVGHDREWQANTFQFVTREGLMKKGTQHARVSWGTLGISDNCEDQQLGAIYCLRSGGRQLEGDAGELTSKREKGKVQGNGWSAKESWNSCVNKMKKGSTKLSVSAACKLAPLEKELMESNCMSKNGASRIMKEEDKGYRLMKAKSLSSTPLAKSPVRSAEYIAGNNNIVGGLNESYVGLYAMQGGAASGISGAASSALKKCCNKKVGFAASCPASMRSSPHHSGLLAVVNKATPDLHTAIQGAIAHCKQSQVAAAGTPPP